MIEFVTPRATVEVILPDGRTLSGPRNSPIGDFLKVLPEVDDPPIVGAVVNGELRELTYRIDRDARVRLVTMADADGALIYRRSLTFLLEAAFEDLFPEASVTIDHSVSSGGFYCQVCDLQLTFGDLERLEEHMFALVAQDLPFERRQAPLEEAVAYFQSRGHMDKVRLLSYRQKANLVLYRLGQHQDYHHGYMLPSTGYLRWLKLLPVQGGFILRFPRRNDPKTITRMGDYPKLLAAFRQYGDWLERLGIDSVGVLNDAFRSNRTREVILVAEALHERQIASVATQIAERREHVRLVLISGPSSSGKTTFSKRLAVQLLALGISPYPLELDNYFVDRDRTPRDEKGEFDYEVLDALDRPRLSRDLNAMIAGEQVTLPKYNFRSGCSESGDVVQLHPGQLIILEGIHGLNPELIPGFPAEHAFRVYVSCLTQLNLDRHNRISTTDTRLLRRIVRDARERGYSAQQTIQRWESVKRGEKRHIFPFQENADVFFNSAMVYEVSALKPLAEPLLRQVPFGSLEYIEAKRLLAFLEWFLPLEAEFIPDNSILREFLGGSILRDFKIWQNG